MLREKRIKRKKKDEREKIIYIRIICTITASGRINSPVYGLWVCYNFIFMQHDYIKLHSKQFQNLVFTEFQIVSIINKNVIPVETTD